MRKALAWSLVAAALLACAAASAGPAPREVTLEEIEGFFRMTEEELIEALGDDYVWTPTGGEGWLDGMEYAELGLIFAYFEDEGLLFLDCLPTFEFRGVRADEMSFAEIMGVWGETTIHETWVETPDHPAFALEYYIGDCFFMFLSFDADGASGSRLTITYIPEP